MFNGVHGVLVGHRLVVDAAVEPRGIVGAPAGGTESYWTEPVTWSWFVSGKVCVPAGNAELRDSKYTMTAITAAPATIVPAMNMFLRRRCADSCWRQLLPAVAGVLPGAVVCQSVAKAPAAQPWGGASPPPAGARRRASMAWRSLRSDGPP